jgi:hypothetical protein
MDFWWLLFGLALTLGTFALSMATSFGPNVFFSLALSPAVYGLGGCLRNGFREDYVNLADNMQQGEPLYLQILCAQEFEKVAQAA